MKKKFKQYCDELLKHYNRNYKQQFDVGHDLYSEYLTLSQKSQNTWKREVISIIENNSSNYIGFAIGLMTKMNDGLELLIGYLKKYPIRNENKFNEIALFALVEANYKPLKEELETIEAVLPTIQLMPRFQFLMRFISMNKSFGLENLCLLLCNELNEENFLKNYSSYIMATLREVDSELPSKLIFCLTQREKDRVVDALKFAGKS